MLGSDARAGVLLLKCRSKEGRRNWEKNVVVGKGKEKVKNLSIWVTLGGSG